jgi:pimeloyl-ACP methyl ester carboxylesterase
LSTIGAHATTHHIMRVVGWLLGPVFLGGGDGRGCTDLLATLEAEDVFDLHDRLAGITPPTLVVGGGRDACYGHELLEQTAALISHGTALVYPRKGHIGVQNRRVAHDIQTFLNGA